MPPDDQLLDALAQRIADGEPVDWSDAAAHTVGDETRVLEQLRAVSRLAEINRTFVHGDDELLDARARWAHLTLEERVAEGSFGEIYRAWDNRLHREVALKLLRDEESTTTGLGSAVIEEGRLLARVRHPNVVTVYGADRADGRVGLWMEFVHGHTLDALLEEIGAMSAEEATVVGSILCDALAAVHRAGLIHGDVKAHNVMREHGGRIVLMDFGAGAERFEEPGRRERKGTPLYVAPEILSGHAATTKSDIYSLGVLLYHLVSGDYPVEGGHVTEVAAAHVRGDRRLLDDARPDLPKPFRDVVQRAIAPDPQARYESAAAMGRALAAAMNLAPAVPAHESAPAVRRGVIIGALGIGVAVAATIAALVLARPWTSRAGGQPVFERLTYRSGRVLSARFVPGGRNVVYSAEWNDSPAQLFSTLEGSRESRPLGHEHAALLGISNTGQLALQLNSRFLRGYVSTGTLAEASVSGGGTHEIVPGVQQADWTRDGALVVVREIGGRSRLESPPGRILYDSGGWISSPRVSPDGRFVAFIDHAVPADDSGGVALIDLRASAPAKIDLSGGWVSIQGLAWHPQSGEIWFTATKAGNSRGLQAVTRNGRERTVAQTVLGLTLYDVSPAGSALVTADMSRIVMMTTGANGAARERDVSWLDWSLARDLSEDGSSLLFNESGEGGGANYSVYLRRLDEPTAVRLGSGSALSLSPDGHFALARMPGERPRLALLPTTAGDVVTLPDAGLQYQQWASWFPGGSRIVFTASEPGHGPRLYTQDVPGGTPHCITPDGEGVYLTSPDAVSPDGRRVLAVASDQRIVTVPAEGGALTAVPGANPGELPLRWTADGGIFVHARGESPARIYRIDPGGRRSLARELVPPDRRTSEILRIVLTSDAATSAYSYTLEQSDLFVVGGLR